MIAALLVLLLPTADAGVQRCVECCQEQGLASCPTRIRVVGEGSAVSREGAAWRVNGLWWLDCERGASFEPGATVALDHAPSDGEIIRLASPPETVRCYSRHCGIPAGVCIIENAGVFQLLRCTDAQPLSTVEMGRASLSAPLNPTAPLPPAVTPLPETTGRITASLRLPDAPVERCDTSAVVAAEARRRISLGDIARAQADLDGSMKEYLAALAMDRCSALAWAALGQTALQGDRPAEAIQALQIATQLQPDHYAAYTNLGQALERLGQLDRASIAYGEALSIQPSHTPAAHGLARVRARLYR
ncbi:MAG: tetratricopeptide repeat protein [Myxococcota bacterium]|nr:tetratricopeptide repeat protein [Myxococcota bacterium]